MLRVADGAPCARWRYCRGCNVWTRKLRKCVPHGKYDVKATDLPMAWIAETCHTATQQ